MAVSSSGTRGRLIGRASRAGHGSRRLRVEGSRRVTLPIPLVTKSPVRVNRKPVEAGTTVPTDFGEKVAAGLVRISDLAQAGRAIPRNRHGPHDRLNWHAGCNAVGRQRSTPAANPGRPSDLGSHPNSDSPRRAGYAPGSAPPDILSTRQFRTAGGSPSRRPVSLGAAFPAQPESPRCADEFAGMVEPVRGGEGIRTRTIRRIIPRPQHSDTRTSRITRHRSDGLCHRFCRRRRHS
jgi:hypothetical protein